MADAPEPTYYVCTREGAAGLEAMVACATFVIVHHVPGKASLESLGWTASQPFDSYAEAEAAKAIILDSDVGITPEGVMG